MPSVWDYANNKYVIGGTGVTIAGGILAQNLPGELKRYAGILAAAGILSATYGFYKVSKVEEERVKGIRPTIDQIETARELDRALPHIICSQIKRYESIFREFADMTFNYNEESLNQSGGFHFHISENNCEGIMNVKLNGASPKYFYLDKVQGFWVLEIYAISPNSKITFTLDLPEAFFTGLEAGYRAWTSRENYAIDCAGIIESFRCPQEGECNPLCYGLHTAGVGDLINCSSIPIIIPAALFRGTIYYDVTEINQGSCR